MRSRLREVSSYLKPSQRPSYLLEVLAAVESGAGELSQAELLEAIGQAARLEAVLRARYAAAVAPAPPPAGDPPPGRYLDPVQAARYLGISRSTLRRLVDRADLKPSRLSEGVVRFDREALDAYAARRE